MAKNTIVYLLKSRYINLYHLFCSPFTGSNDHIAMETLSSDLPFGVFSFIPAQKKHASALTDLLLLSGEGLFEYLLEQHPSQDIVSWLSDLVSSTDNSLSYINWRICLLDDDLIGGTCLVPSLLADIFAPAFSLDEERQAFANTFRSPQDNSYHVLAFAVCELFRKQKVGSTLLTWALSEAKSQGYSELSLFCRKTNEGAIQFYQSFGFDTAYETKDVIESPIPGSYYMIRSI